MLSVSRLARKRCFSSPDGLPRSGSAHDPGSGLSFWVGFGLGMGMGLGTPAHGIQRQCHIVVARVTSELKE